MIITQKEKLRILNEHIKHGYKTILENISNKKIYVLVGPPSVGKSTWIKNYFTTDIPYVISRDDIVEEVAERLGLTYDDLFEKPNIDANIGDEHEKYGKVIPSPPWMSFSKLSYDKIADANKQVVDLFDERIKNAKGEQNIVIDMTNIGTISRKNILNKLSSISDDYKKIAVVFNFKGGEDIIKKMAQKRADEYKAMGKSKTLPPEVIDRMFANYQDVQPDEGFDEVMHVDNIPTFKNI